MISDVFMSKTPFVQTNITSKGTSGKTADLFKPGIFSVGVINYE